MADANLLEYAVTQPVVFAAPTDVELAPAPIPSNWVVEGSPQAHSKRLSTSADGTAVIIAWSCTPGRFHWHYNSDEIAHVVSGEVFLTDQNGVSRRVGAGDMVYFPAGSSMLWHVTQEIRKIAICRQPMPLPFGFALRAWNKLAGILGGPDEEGEALGTASPARSGAEGATAV
jgi:uncharacterized protein